MHPVDTSWMATSQVQFQCACTGTPEYNTFWYKFKDFARPKVWHDFLQQYLIPVHACTADTTDKGIHNLSISFW